MDSGAMKAWIDTIFYDIGKQQNDFYIQWSDKDGIEVAGSKITHSKWKKYSEVCFDPSDSKNRWFLEKANQRQILPIEVVLDLESEEQLQPALEKSKEMDLRFHVFSTGSRGYHIHLFFNRVLKEAEKLSLISYFGADPQKAS